MSTAGESRATAEALPQWTLMSRLDCPLCSHFEAALVAWPQGLGRFHLTVLNIDSSPALVERYGMRVPVLLDGEREICALRFRPERAAAALPSP